MLSHKTVTITLLAASSILFLALIIGSASQPACFPWHDAKRVEPVSCYKHSGNEVNPSWKIQTISEMTARSGLTAELLSGFAAFSLIAIYNALFFIKSNLKGQKTYFQIVDATFALGSLGFVGLTVWNLRVESTVHSCFTTQTIIAVFIQMSVLTFSIHKPTTINWVNLATMVAAMLEYVILFATYPSPIPDGDGYFDAKYYMHAYGQFIFFGLYFWSLYYIVVNNCYSKSQGYRQINSGQTLSTNQEFGSLRL